MAWTMLEIERDWILGSMSELAASPESAVEAFERTERLLGRGWIDKSRLGAGDSVISGTSPTLRVVNMGQKLSLIEDLAERERLLERIRGGDRSAEGELTAIYLLRRPNPKLAVELYPKVSNREADFRVKAPADDGWTYIEVTQLEESEAQDRAKEIMRRIAAAVKETESTFALEVLLRRVPTESEIGEILARVPVICGHLETAREELSESLGFLSLNQSEPGVVVIHEHPGEENISRLGIAHAVVGPGLHRRHLSVRMSFSDDRATAMLHDEAQQLPKDSPGLVMAGVGLATGAIKTWEPLLRSRFRPTMHTRVGGVFLWNGATVATPKGMDQLFHTQLIVNPHAALPLPNWIVDTLSEIGDEFKRIENAEAH